MGCSWVTVFTVWDCGDNHNHMRVYAGWGGRSEPPELLCLRMRPFVMWWYILGSAACGTYVIVWLYLIILEHMVPIFIQRGYSVSSEVIVSHLLRENIYISCQFLNSNHVVMSRGNKNFHLRFFFCKKQGITVWYHSSLLWEP
jgi:hypothetical protein